MFWFFFWYLIFIIIVWWIVSFLNKWANISYISDKWNKNRKQIIAVISYIFIALIYWAFIDEENRSESLYDFYKTYEPSFWHALEFLIYYILVGLIYFIPRYYAKIYNVFLYVEFMYVCALLSELSTYQYIIIQTFHNSYFDILYVSEFYALASLTCAFIFAFFHSVYKTIYFLIKNSKNRWLEITLNIPIILFIVFTIFSASRNLY